MTLIATCRDTYGLPDTTSARREEETRALCTSEYSDISPLTGGNVMFSTLEGRPSARYFDTSDALHSWVSATDIRITLDRLNTFGDEVFGDPQVLKSYFYAIADVSVAGRCACNGHASECDDSGDGSGSLVCRCDHFTTGQDCQQCLPFYNDAPWGRANDNNAHECKPCNCNGFSRRCFFDKELYEATGHGGHCLDCAGNRDGANCERCRDNYYQRNDSYCVPCQCNEVGSRSLQCNSEGRCQCKPGVTGDKCDRCDANFYEFGPNGCKACNCHAAGSFNNQPKCDELDGTCHCKQNVEGKQCRVCKPGYFNMDEENEFGCTPCFCYGHSSVCNSAQGYSRIQIESNFGRHAERWSAKDVQNNNVSVNYLSETQVISVTAPDRDSVYFIAPDRFLGDQRASYNQDLEFKLRVGRVGQNPSVNDIILEGAGKSIIQPIFGQGNQLPSTTVNTFRYRLHNDPDYGWQPRLSERDFMSVLANLTAIKIRGTYTPTGIGFLDEVRLESARRGAAGAPASWIEMCACPVNYVGQFCESCAPGSRHDPPQGGPFSPCVPCDCNSHADICDADSGRCICQHNTAGDNCEKCAKGFYGNALQGTAYDCKVCPCPNQGACMQIKDDVVICLECPKGYSGSRCDLCSDGYYGDPTGRNGPVRLCEPCDCNDNVDPNAVGNCNRTTGQCLKCIYNTGGPNCDQCLPGFYGDALALPKGDCQPCQCYAPGTASADGSSADVVCDQLSGQCQCRAHVIGTNCDQCEPGYYNIQSGQGCTACNCDPTGSVNHTCNTETGQCYCKPGITGAHCDVCQAYYYGFSSEGCKPCDCDPIGSKALQCDPNGQCPCLENVEDRRCDRCKENKFNRQLGCVDCPACYNLVQDAATSHRSNLRRLDGILADIAANPTVINDADFEAKLHEVMARVDRLWNEAKAANAGGDKTLLDQLNELHARLDDVQVLMRQIHNWTEEARQQTGEAERDATEAEIIIERAREALQGALDYLQTDGAAALKKAMDRSTEFGQQSQQMSEMAREARRLVQQQKEEYDNINWVAEKAVNVSTDAYELAKDTINQQKNTSDELKILASDLAVARDLLDSANRLSAEVKGHVTNVHTEALDLYRDIYALTIPTVDTATMRQDAQLLSAEAKAMQAKGAQLMDNYRGVLDDVETQLSGADAILDSATRQQQSCDDLLADADAAKALAEDAVTLGNKTLTEAEQTLKTLQDFDNKIQESKDKATEALQQIPEIVSLIKEAEKKTTNAQEALAGAENNARSANAIAQDAQTKYAEQASKEADEIRKSAEVTKNEAGKLRDEADALASRVVVTATKVNDLEEQAKNDGRLTKLAKEKVGQANASAFDALERVQNALEDVNNVIKDLKDLVDVDADALDRLEEKLARAEHEFMAVDLDKKLAELDEARIAQTQFLKDYEEELKRLKVEVDNIEEIDKALPNKDRCFKRTRLEP
ncbi:laminin subunit gamma-1 [Nilaparvata lugens]|uniref:laminin subunit gamma-1 n=1 Tax=Nilaparvata lugens TaxID=108931 RepID=UPI00193CE5F1|nr:laminin subunit gamma-1 [Nilaparvata lugens]